MGKCWSSLNHNKQRAKMTAQKAEEADLLSLLEDLIDDEFKNFKWYLDKEKLGDMEPIKVSHLQKAKRRKVVNLMVQKYELTGAVEVMKSVLKKINRNDLVKKLSDISSGSEGAVSSGTDRSSNPNTDVSDGGSKPEQPAETHTNTGETSKLITEMTGDNKGSNPGPSSCEATVPKTETPHCSHSDVAHNSVRLKIPPPRFGAENVTSYCVEYCVSGEDGWKQTPAAKAEELTVSGLTPNTEYMFRCRAVTSVGVGPAGEVSGPIKTLPCSPPGKPQVETNSSEITVSWEKPAEIGQDVHILSYIVEYAQTEKEVKEEDLQWNQMVSRTEKGIISGLQSETEYAVRVRCDCGEAGRSKESITVNVCTTKHGLKQKSFDRLIDCVKEKSTLLKPQTGPLPIYKIPLKEEQINVPGCKRFSFGKESTKPNRTIMVLGATGAGMSTLINGMINYILGVEWEDSFRFKLVDEDQSKSQAHSQTSEVTAYKINHQEGFKINHSLTIVDTPGFANTNGIKIDRKTTEQIRNLFTAQSGVSEIDAICFLAQALARLKPSQKYVFDSVLSIFGKDVAENIRVLVTFADGQRPPVLEAINKAEVPCPKTKDGLPVHFKFNNSALFADNKSSAANSSDEDDEYGGFDQMLWNMGTKSMKRFFVALNEMKTKSLTMTKEVLRERKQLEDSVENLQKQVKVGLAKLEMIKETTEQLKELKEKYLKASEAKTPVQASIEKLKAEYKRVQAEVEKQMERSTKYLNTLKEIALRPNPLSTPDYINLLIEEEKAEGKPGWKQRVEDLMDMREREELKAKVERGEKLLR